MKIKVPGPDHAVWFWLTFVAGFWVLTWNTNIVASIAAGIVAWVSVFVVWRHRRDQVNERNAADPLHPYSP